MEAFFEGAFVEVLVLDQYFDSTNYTFPVKKYIKTRYFNIFDNSLQEWDAKY